MTPPHNALAADPDIAANDLGPLAWVMEELRKSLEGAIKATRRFVRDAELALGQDMASLDASQLRIARQQLHQAVGALEMVGLRAPAHMLRTMESVAQRFIQKPELCSDDAATTLERASFALTEYLDGLVKGKNASAVALFPQYRGVAELAGLDRVHPADLWTLDWRWLEVAELPEVQPMPYSPATRERLDWSILNVVKSGDIRAARRLTDLACALSAGQDRLQPRTFWAIAAAYFDALAAGAIVNSVYSKRAASRVLQQYATLSKGERNVSDRLAQDLLFFCAVADMAKAESAACLHAVRQAYGLAQAPAVDFETEQFGRFDPALLQLLRKRIAAASEGWSALSGGDVQRLKQVSEHFASVGDLMGKLHPESKALARALQRTIDSTVASNACPSAAVAMEVATTVLYLDAVYEDLDPTNSELARRAQRLAQRLDLVSSGQGAAPMEVWMEELYRRVSDRQTMGSVVAELRGALGEVEKSLDAFFRNTQDKGPLREVPNHLASMRGVFSVLGLDQPSIAAQRMRLTVEQLLVDEIAQGAGPNPLFEQLGINLGAMGFLIDMLSYQRELAKKLFVFDEDSNTLQVLMGRVGAPAPELVPEMEPVITAASQPQPLAPPEISFDLDLDLPSASGVEVLSEPEGVLAPVAPELPVSAPPVAMVSAPLAPQPSEDDDDAELLDIFLDEAREVVHNALHAIERLGSVAHDVGELTVLRRAFHTLKGSSRMVGLTEFGEAAWSFEQVMNDLLAEQRGAHADLLRLTGSAMQAFGRWIEDIAAGVADGAWRAADFRASADAMRQQGRYHALPWDEAVDSAVQPAPGVPELSAPEVPGLPALEQPVLEVNVPPLPLPEVAELTEPALEVSEAFGLFDAPMPEFDLAQPQDSAVAAHSQAEPEVADRVLEIDLSEPGTEPVLAGPLEAQETPAPSVADFSATEPLNLEEAAPVALDTQVLEIDLGDFDFGDAGAGAQIAAAPTPAPVEGLSVEALPQEAIALDFPFEDGVVEVVEAAAPMEVSEPAAEVAELPSGVEIALDFPLEPAQAVSDGAAVDADLPSSEPPVSEIDLDFGDQDEAVQAEPMPAVVADAAAADQVLPTMEEGVLADLGAMEPPASETVDGVEPLVEEVAEVPEANALSDDALSDDSVKVIGPLRMSIPLYNVFLNEADEWSRRLQTELSEWALGLDEPLPESTVVWAHSLGGSSATVGFVPLSELARALEHALQHVRLHRAANPAMAQVFNDAAEEVRRLLHQFAAGFLKENNAQVLAALQQIITTEFSPAGVVDGLTLEESLRSAVHDSSRMAPMGPLGGMAVAAPLAVVEDDEDDELDAVDNLDQDLFPIFEEEALELLPQLSAALRQWIAHPEDMEARADVLRVLHTLKGSARLAGAMRMGEMAHHMETSIEHIGAQGLQTQQLEPLQARFDRLEKAFDRLRSGLHSTPGAVDAAPSAGAAAASDALESVTGAALPVQGAVAPLQATQMPMPAVPLSVAAAGLPAAPVARVQGQQNVRVRSRLLDRLVNQAGEVLITRSRMDGRVTQIRSSLEDLGSNLERLRQQLRDLELQSESQMQSRMAQAKETAQAFDPLEFDRFTRVQELTRMMAESVHDVATVQRNLQREVDSTEDDLIAQGRQARELQRDLLRTRMVEFESIAERLYGVVRQAAKDTGKPVKLDIVGGAIEMDRGVLERMVPSFEHMLRNAVSHGIEDADTREAVGKPAMGSIVVQVDQHSNDVSVSFSDDGGGLHLDRIRERAIAQGLVDAQQELSTEQAANLIFLPGFSTAEQVTELSGRGIGMDVVRAEVSAMGGRIETGSEPGQGSRFKLVLPLTTAVTQVVMLRMGDFTVGVPSNLVETVQRSQASVVQAAYEGGVYPYGAEALPFHWLGALLQASSRSTEMEAKSLQVVVLQSAGQRVAAHVDEVLGNREVVVKHLGPQLARLPGLTGMSVLASGAVVLIYNPVALASVYGERSRAITLEARAQAAAAPSPSAVEPAMFTEAVQLPLVLVVDDSITVRRVTQRLLKREGYRVTVANDGLQALEKLMEEKPAVVLSDIEMPRMDGFDLARNIRGDARLHDLPIIMITSRIAQKHRDHAKELGVDHYLGKPYSEDELLALVHKYAHQVHESVF